MDLNQEEKGFTQAVELGTRVASYIAVIIVNVSNTLMYREFEGVKDVVCRTVETIQVTNHRKFKVIGNQVSKLQMNSRVLLLRREYVER